MQVQTLQLSVVVAGSDNNPTVLNPDFLRYNEIVPEKWGWSPVAPTISTPPFSQVSYDSGVTITVDPTKIQIVDKNSSPTIANTHIIEMAKKYASTLRHVAYSATGLNFTAYVPIEDPSAYIKKRFICSGTWDTLEHPLNEVGLRLVYALEQGRINFSIDPGEVAPLSNNEDLSSFQLLKSVVINANFHRECLSKYPNKLEEILRNLNYALQDESKYLTLLHEILLA